MIQIVRSHLIFTILYQNRLLLIEWNFERGNWYPRVHSDFSNEYVRKYFNTLFHNAFTGNLLREEVFPHINFCTNMASKTALVWIFLGGLVFPLVVWTYGEFIQIWLFSDVWKFQSLEKMQHTLSLRLLISMELKTYIFLKTDIRLLLHNAMYDAMYDCLYYWHLKVRRLINLVFYVPYLKKKECYWSFTLLQSALSYYSSKLRKRGLNH